MPVGTGVAVRHAPRRKKTAAAATAVVALTSMLAMSMTPITAHAGDTAPSSETLVIPVISVTAPSSDLLEASWGAPDDENDYGYGGYVRKAGEGDVPRVRPGTVDTSRDFTEDSLGREIEPDTLYEVAMDARDLAAPIDERLPKTTWVQVRTPAADDADEGNPEPEPEPDPEPDPEPKPLTVTGLEVNATGPDSLEGSWVAPDGDNEYGYGSYVRKKGEGDVNRLRPGTVETSRDFTEDSQGRDIEPDTVYEVAVDARDLTAPIDERLPKTDWVEVRTPAADEEPKPEPDPDPKPDPQPEPDDPSDWDRSKIGDRSWYEANTGPRDLDESNLKVHEGRLNLRNDGMVLENLEVNGSLHVVGDDITVRNVVVNGTLDLRESNGALIEDVIVRASGPYPINARSARDWVVQYAEVDGRRSPTNNGGLYGGGGTVRYSEFHSHTDSAKVESNSVWEYNWLHTNSTWGTDAHVDGLQSMGASNVMVRGNYIDMPISLDANSAIIAQSNFGSIRNWTVKENYLNGGNYTIYFRSKGHGDPENIVIEDNRIGRDYRYGLLSSDGNGITTSDNVWHDNGIPAM